MMKHMKTDNDEELYQQMISKWKNGADEYDKIMAQRLEAKHTQQQRPFRWLVLAASILFPVMGISIYLIIEKNKKEIADPATVKSISVENYHPKQDVFIIGNISDTKTANQKTDMIGCCHEDSTFANK